MSIAATLTILGIHDVVPRVRGLVVTRCSNGDVLGAVHVACGAEFGVSHLGVGASTIDLVTVDGLLGRGGGAAAGTEGA